MNSSWSIRPLGALCDVLDSKRKPITKKDRKPGSFPYYGATGILDHVEEYIFDEKLVLIGEDGAKWGIGENTAFVADGKYWVNNHAHVIRPHRTTVLGEWIIYYLNASDLSPFITGLTVPKLNQAKMRDIPIPLPPLPEQRRIVAILDDVFEGVASATNNFQRNVVNARELFQSYLQSALSGAGKAWTEKKLSEVCEKITDGTHQTPTYYDKGIVFLSSRNVTSGRIDWEKIKYIDQKQHLEMHKRVAPKINDILLAKNGTTGVAAIVDKDVVFDIYVSLALLRAKEDIDARFLLYFINSPIAKKQFNKRLKGIGVPNLHLEEIREVVVSFPRSIQEQQSIVSKLDSMAEEVSRVEAIYQQKLEGLAELKQAILHKAFSGALNAPAAKALLEAAE